MRAFRSVLALRLAVVLLLCLAGSGCASASRSFDEKARALQFERGIVDGAGFRHVVFAKPGRQGEGRLHVYLGGDGTPWLRGRVPAADPTPRQPVALGLMASDLATSVLLGRPCYHGLAAEPGCHPALWTDRRYGEDVVSSMSAALSKLAGDERSIVLIGYSGGGALAMLLAERHPGIAAVVTVAANLDIDIWAAHHGYDRLRGSLNPAERPPLPPGIIQIHLAGGRDRRVPGWLVAAALARKGSAPPVIVTEAGHEDGWRERWRAVMAGLDEQLAARHPTKRSLRTPGAGRG